MVQKAAQARERFETAALALFGERGYARTTVPEIAARAGLTERTFFRYFADKPEVLFWRAGELKTTIVDAIARAPAAATPLDALLDGLEALGGVFDTTRAEVSARHALVAAHPEFQARDMLKKLELTATIGDALCARGATASEARIASEIGMAIWRVAFGRWLEDQERSSFIGHVLRVCKEVHSSASHLRCMER